MSIKKIFSLLSKRERRKFGIVFCAFLVMGFIELAGVGSIGPFISVASNPAMIHSNKYLAALYEYFQFQSDSSFIFACGITVIVVLCISNLSLAGINFISYRVAASSRYSISMRLLEKYLRQPYLFYLNTNSASLSNKVLNEVNGFVSAALLSSLQLISAAVISVFIITLLIVLNPLLALLVSLVLGLSYLFIFLVIRKYIARKGKESLIYNTKKYKYINETFGGIKDIKILGKEQVFINLFKEASYKSSMITVFTELASDMPKFLIETIAISGIILVILFLMSSGQSMDQFLPVLTIYAFGAYRLLPSMQKMYRAVSNIKFCGHIIDSLNADFALPEGTPLSVTDAPRLAFRGTITLKDITFSYPNTDKDVIDHQTLQVTRNSSIALVGSTGCGKTTLADIILGLLEPQTGTLLVDGAAITPDNIKSWQKNLGYVPQSIYLTDDTVRNNIAFGIDPAKIDDEAVARAAKLANIHTFVTEELADGYDTVIGEKGIRLSGGQRQRIGIARAVYHDPDVLILDEATSALDGLTEAAIMEAIENLADKKTIIMIAHRITTVKNCDVIYMMEKGRIVDSGSYADLYQRNAVFKKLADGN
jgi:ABC-type multidrug transport system fused ATPase/permease subunit